MGLEPTTFELEVQHASPLRHGGFMSILAKQFLRSLFFFSCKQHFVFPSVTNFWQVRVPPPEEFLLFKKYSKSLLQVNLSFPIAVFCTVTPVLCTWCVKLKFSSRAYLSHLEQIGLHCLLFQCHLVCRFVNATIRLLPILLYSLTINS